MKLIEASYEILPSHGHTLPDIYKDIERAGRTCYKSENKITEDSAEPFVKMIMERKHTAVLEQGTVYLYFPYLLYNNTVLKYKNNPYSKVEFNSNIIWGENGEKKCIPLEYGYAGYYITTNYRVIIENHWESDLTFICEPTEYHQKRISVRFICSRAIANELVRHRVFSYCQESSRYCNYSKEKFGANITYIIPYWINKDLIKDNDFSGDVFQDTENKELVKLGRFKASLKQCEYDYRCGGDYKEIESRKLKLNVAGVPHVYAFGGLHGAIEKYNGSGSFLHIDVSSYYPSLIIVNGFMSRKSQEPQTFTHLRDMRYELKAKNDPRHKIYKILINATFGAMKSEYNALYDPKQANNICINGQIILTQLIVELSPLCQLIQSNTDGLVVKYKEADYDKIVEIVTDFGSRFGLTFDIDKIIKVAQRDVNNYAIMYENGKIEAKGRFSKFDNGDFKQNSLSIIDRALVNYYINGKSVADTVIEAYTNNDLAPFQIICKMGSTYNGMYYEYGAEGETKLIPTQKVNRVFATNDKKYWGIYKRKGDSYQKIANTSEHNIIHNETLDTFDKSKLDLNYYIALCNKNLY